MTNRKRFQRFLILAATGCVVFQIVSCLTIGLGPVILSVLESVGLSVLVSR
jgi:hypothetical protein